MPLHSLKSKLHAGVARVTQSRWLPRSKAEKILRALNIKGARRKGRRGLQGESHRLRSGLWVCEGLRLWRHWSQPIPEHLRQTKTKGLHAKSQSTSARWLYTLRQYMDPWSPRPIYVQNKTLGPSAGFPIFIGTRTKEAIFLDPDAGRAARSAGDTPYSQEYVDLRIRYGRHISAPTFEVTEDGRFLLEEFIHGSHFESLPDVDQMQVVRRLFSMHNSLARAEGQGSCTGLISQALDTITQIQIPESLRRRLDRMGSVRLKALADTWPLTPSQCDFHAKNILVVGTEPVVIDFGPTKMRLVPFFADMMEFIGRDEGHLIEQFHAGIFDTHLADLCTSANVAVPDATEMKENFILAYALTRPLMRSPRTVKPTRYERLTTEYWRNHERYLSK